jgi:DNA-binding IclR family transcriptional regulator
MRAPRIVLDVPSGCEELTPAVRRPVLAEASYGRLDGDASRQRPPYAITSVDNALQLVQILARDGSLRVSDAAAELGVAKSTAHRLLGMLCYRNFARKDDDHVYWRGPALGQPHVTARRNDLSTVAAPFLEQLQRESDETVHLVVLRGTEVEFLTSLECTQSLRVGSRAGAVMGAFRTSGGQALLAALPDTELAARYPDGVPESGLDQAGLRRALAAVRRRRYGINEGLSERGVVAIGVAVRGADGQPVASVCVSAPAFRLPRRRFQQAADILHQHVASLETELARTATRSAM